MDQQDVEHIVRTELNNSPSTTPAFNNDFQMASGKTDKKHQATLQGMVDSGRSTALAIQLVTALSVYAQGKLEASAVTMMDRLLYIQETRSDVVAEYMGKVTGKLMVSQQAGVMALTETLTPRLAEFLLTRRR